ncbi:hypothetical protein G6F57_000077 [Rhizopus arrhizus]|uniref:NodB homology domain-containing protein n=1 Tax=Rhizopus oryzae TaxID=64495 RepID=A0A9P7BYD7_RHIOR|nr:hypothetical protein G6F23_003662 [Rhizopus arrhizus]KAG1418602.1 hypothetical protein G6F58_005001 [Rhizopus delemar]KAG0770606.1 hypothetical protein G6F24_000064 [Rhizopus arrhizus]KAG0794411.1 hypothetical protein G6F21_002882 [Rhizopus arrhizus]KAG0800068.1 hypothetical protein G6F22_002598 [Rhizopus arrhizus]
MKSLSIIASITLAFISSAIAQEGATVPTANTGSSSTYSCDPNTCKIANNCLCASQSPPGGLSPKDTPQFVTVTYDDSIQASLFNTAASMVNVTNPNGCPGHGTWFVSMEYTDFSLVQQWYAAGNEIADHTFSHVGTPSSQEISSTKSMLNAYGGIPSQKIQGFRAPFLNYTKDTLNILSEQGFLYDSSSSAVTDDAYWPYTLDNGMANDCWTGICAAGQVKLPGLWEIPMYSVLDNASIPQLMDVYLAGTPSDVTQWSNAAFEKHYNGNRQPFGIYVHPTHLTTYPGLADPKDMYNGVISFIQSIAAKPDVWFVTNQQLLQWMKNPVKASELGSQDYMQCKQPVISKEICNGLDDDHNGVIDDNLVNSCNFGTTSTKTCFNCPSTAPTLSNPTPGSSVQNGTSGYRYPIPETCDTTWWDPIGNTCLCTTADCQLKSVAVPKSTTSSGTNSSSSSSSGKSSTAASSSDSNNLSASIVPVILVTGLITTLSQLF